MKLSFHVFIISLVLYTTESGYWAKCKTKNKKYMLMKSTFQKTLFRKKQ